MTIAVVEMTEVINWHHPFRRQINLALAVLLIFTQVSCTSKEYDHASDECRREYMVKIPPNYQQQLRTYYRYEQVPDGNISCTRDIFWGQPNCTQGTRTISIPVSTMVTVDLEAGRRQNEINRCSEELCLKRYGNRYCKIK